MFGGATFTLGAIQYFIWAGTSGYAQGRLVDINLRRHIQSSLAYERSL